MLDETSSIKHRRSSHLTKRVWSLGIILVALLLVQGPLDVFAQFSDPTVVHVLYFYAVDCEHCKVVDEEVLKPLEIEYGSKLEIQRLETGVSSHYELLIRAEEQFSVSSEDRGIPTLVIGEHILIGETPVREQLRGLIEEGVAQGGVPWPDLPGLESAISTQPWSMGAEGAEVCTVDSPEACETDAPIWAAYFYQVGCQECSRAELDVQYIQERYPQLLVEEFDLYDDAALAQWLSDQAGRDALVAPAVVIGEDALVGEAEITPQNLEQLVQKYATTGSPRIWADFDQDAAQQGLVDRFRSFGPLAVVFAGLIDGLNPCAFATIAFFVSYLALSGRKGKEILVVGAAFTLGVFLAYLTVGLGFYRVLALLGDLLTQIGRWVYGITAVLCAVLAIISFLDFLKARRGDVGDMSLNLPHKLRMRINAVIRKGRQAKAFVIGAFITGVVVSFLELACTGQVYLPTIIFVASLPELRVQAITYLVLYNLLFILPLVVVFILAYFGTTSRDLSLFLQRRAAAVKLGMVILFTSLAAWLGTSLLL